HLFFAAEFLRDQPRNTQFVNITGSDKGIVTSNGLGIVEAVNLDGDQNSIGILNDKVIAGDKYRQIPSAIVFR
ncbi:MAG TPA: hypothetical protein VK629_02765, partial [Steroidobacteraceae bacterium]|nr:hypothetical protein [Steroidobacteraceae bacterium]